MVNFKQGLGVLLLGASMLIAGCKKEEKALGGAAIGAGSGALVGGLAGGPTGAAIGAVGGGVAGGAIGYSMGDDEEKGDREAK